MVKPETERRRLKRFAMELPVTVKTQDGGERKCTSRDLSAGGILLDCDLNVVLDSPIQLTMMLPSEITGGEKELARCYGRVVRVVENSAEGQRGIAVKVECLELPADRTAA